jgi:hypothetical protein
MATLAELHLARLTREPGADDGDTADGIQTRAESSLSDAFKEQALATYSAFVRANTCYQACGLRNDAWLSCSQPCN